ncbi:VAD1 Analog of StAR-related lipid transfer domain containing protein, putative [Leishmania lindenbergi]|uniref:VAD1 like protein of StAR-related lipid transfer domain containing protein n=1 Tax=Leishmania lindenbergi TaxID=651832 RepID=A0AAW3A315_9TRYP
MPEPLVPMCGTSAEKFLGKQVYKNNKIAQNMFSSATRKDKKVMLPQTLLKGLTIQKLWDNVFQDNTGFLKKYHDTRNESKLSVGQWDYAADRGSGSRFVSLVAIVEVPRAGTPTPLNQAHRFAYITTPEGKLMLVYQISSQTPEVPAGGSFRTEAYFEITADSADSDCSIAIWGNCRKMSMSFSAIQYIATPRAIKEMTMAYRQLVNMVSEEFCGGAAAPADDGGVVSEGDAGDSGASSGDGGGLGSVFHGALLVLAVLVTLLVFNSTRTMARTSHLAMTMLNLDRSFWESSRVGGRGPTAENTSGWMCEEKALLIAAREAQLQTMRYRWMEQQAEIDHLQHTVSLLKWMAYVQMAAVAVALGGFGYLLKCHLDSTPESS